jgi:hypothetical protein
VRRQLDSRSIGRLSASSLACLGAPRELGPDPQIREHLVDFSSSPPPFVADPGPGIKHAGGYVRIPLDSASSAPRPPTAVDDPLAPLNSDEVPLDGSREGEEPGLRTGFHAAQSTQSPGPLQGAGAFRMNQ